MLSAQHRVLLAEPDPVLRGLLADNLRMRGFVVDVVASCVELLKSAERSHPTVLIVDPDDGASTSCMDAVVSVLDLAKPLSLVFLTNAPEPRFIGLDRADIPQEAAYVHKSRLADPSVLAEAIQASMMRSVRQGFRDDLAMNHPLRSLSNAQVDVLRMVALGYSNPQIARLRATTIRAVENLVSRMYLAVGIVPDGSVNERVLAARRFIAIAGLPVDRTLR